MAVQCSPWLLASLACSLLVHSALQAQPAILATFTFRGEDPAILHVLGEGFGVGTSQVRVDFNGRPCPFWVLNDAHLVLVCPDNASSSPRLDLEVLGQACQYPLSIPPLTVAADPSELLVPESLDPLAGRFNRALTAAFGQTAVTGMPAGYSVGKSSGSRSWMGGSTGSGRVAWRRRAARTFSSRGLACRY